jgi:hypothetical protein
MRISTTAGSITADYQSLVSSSMTSRPQSPASIRLWPGQRHSRWAAGCRRGAWRGGEIHTQQSSGECGQDHGSHRSGYYWKYQRGTSMSSPPAKSLVNTGSPERHSRQMAWWSVVSSGADRQRLGDPGFRGIPARRSTPCAIARERRSPRGSRSASYWRLQSVARMVG